MGIQLVQIFIHRADELPAAIADAARQKIDPVLAFDCALHTPPGFVAGVLNKLGVPVVFHAQRFVDAGGLMSYSVNDAELWRHAATFVDRILKGANPAEIPVEQPTKFDLVVNARTAAALGLAIPSSVKLRVDRWVE
jgi:putative ABC transport system substrate-binding protein